MTSFGKLTLKKGHVMCSTTTKFAISQYLQILLCFIGQSKVYDEASEICDKLLHIDISSPQIQRVCRFYGGLIDPIIDKNLEEYIPVLNDVKKHDNVYVMVDGSFLFTRNDKWKEIKLGRIFSERSVIPINAKRNEVMDSVYVSHMGSVKEFFPKLERHLVSYDNKVIIADGAAWIWNWAESNYPGATQILDFFHAKDKLVIFAKYQFNDKKDRKKWLSDRYDELMNDQVENVITKMQSIRSRNPSATQAKQTLIKYFTDHAERMMYKTYRDKGLLIGSGPIEAAHRNVLQQRMKLSGQKWSIDGANAIANLRCYKKGGSWGVIEKLIKAA